MAGNPRVAYRTEHGVLPHWMAVDRQRREEAERETKRREVEADPFPPHKPRGRHRAPRRKGGWVAATLTYGMALVAGMGISQMAAWLL